MRQGFTVEHCDNGEAGIARIKLGGIDVIALDQYMPGLDGLETLEQIQKQADAEEKDYLKALEQIDRETIAAIGAMMKSGEDFAPRAVRSAI